MDGIGDCGRLPGTVRACRVADVRNTKMTFQRFMAEWVERNTKICGNRSESTCGPLGVSEASSVAGDASTAAKRENTDNIKTGGWAMRVEREKSGVLLAPVAPESHS